MRLTNKNMLTTFLYRSRCRAYFDPTRSAEAAHRIYVNDWDTLLFTKERDFLRQTLVGILSDIYLLYLEALNRLDRLIDSDRQLLGPLYFFIRHDDHILQSKEYQAHLNIISS
jgi:hypothetical protein